MKPKLFMYWENREGCSMPSYLNLCEKTIRHNCENDFEIVLLNEKNIFEGIPECRRDIMDLSIVHRVDYFRWVLLNQYGGVYLDRDFIILKPLTRILNLLKVHNFVGCGETVPNSSKCPSIGFLAMNSNNSIAKRQIEEMDRMLNNRPEKAKQGWTFIGTDLLKHFINDYPYYMLDDEVLFPLYWTKWQQLFESGYKIESHMTNNTLGFALYNSQFNDWFKNSSEKEILSLDIPITRLLKLGMGL